MDSGGGFTGLTVVWNAGTAKEEKRRDEEKGYRGRAYWRETRLSSTPLQALGGDAKNLRRRGYDARKRLRAARAPREYITPEPL